MKFLRYALTVFVIVCNYPAFSQTNGGFITKVVTVMENRLKTTPIEKVQLHLDRSNYAAGDTLWFKAYTVIGDKHQLSAFSGVLYVELISQKDSVVKRLTLQLQSGIGWGDMALLRTYKPGVYRLRAYTNWMRNAGADYFFNQRIYIGALQPTIVGTARNKHVQPDVQFFPEGGVMVAGVRSKIAIKAVAATGLGEDIRGTITDSDGNEVTDFATQHLGMGIFALTPQPGKTYKAKLTAADGSTFTVDLPKALQEGFTLGVNNGLQDSIYVKVAVNNNTLEKKRNSLFYLVAQSQGKVFYISEGRLLGPVVSLTVEKNRFPSGIVQFTLFDELGEPLNERIAFLQSKDSIDVKLTTASSVFTPHQKMTFELACVAGGKPAIGSFSIAVINESRSGAAQASEISIVNNLLLTSDLRGYVEQPNYYFNNTAKARADLDVLMLTQGYRRFEWKALLDNKLMVINYPPQQKLELQGTLKTRSGTVVSGGKITLVATRANVIRDTVSDVNGNFTFNELSVSDTTQFILRARKAHNGSDILINIKERSFPPVLKDDTREPIAEINSSTAAEYNVDMKKLGTEFKTIVDGLTKIVPGLRYTNGNYSYELHPVRHVILDGIEHEANDLNYFSPREFENIRIIAAVNVDSAMIIASTKRYAGTDTTSMINLKEVKVSDKKTQRGPDLSNSSNLHGGGNADQVLMGDKVQGCVTLSQCLQGRVFGVNFSQDGTPVNTRPMGGGKMSIIVDGAVMDGSNLNSVINPNDIYSIEVLRSSGLKAVYGTSIQPGGALIITTKRGGEATKMSSQTAAGLIVYRFNGFSKRHVFYSPTYTAINNSTIDVRNTIYWNPNIITDSKGMASFEFFNADTKGTYRVVVEGIDDNGNLGHRVYTYKVD